MRQQWQENQPADFLYREAARIFFRIAGEAENRKKISLLIFLLNFYHQLIDSLFKDFILAVDREV